MVAWLASMARESRAFSSALPNVSLCFRNCLVKGRPCSLQVRPGPRLQSSAPPEPSGAPPRPRQRRCLWRSGFPRQRRPFGPQFSAGPQSLHRQWPRQGLRPPCRPLRQCAGPACLLLQGGPEQGAFSCRAFISRNWAAREAISADCPEAAAVSSAAALSEGAPLAAISFFAPLPFCPRRQEPFPQAPSSRA